ncbi:MAG: hypothetical protein H5T60_14690 [Anaerolineae bacterium]|nr:hypothetical protein [Anaerolineae bacterium]
MAARNSDEQHLDQWWKGALAGWARRQQAPARAWHGIRPGIAAGPARSTPRSSADWAYFLDMHTWVCLVGLCVIVAGLLLSVYSSAGFSYLNMGEPLTVDHADALSGRAVLVAQRSQQAIWTSLSPALDPLLHCRRGES